MKISNIIKHILDAIFPKSCAGCGIKGKDICSDCTKKIKKRESQQCPSCRRKNKNGTFCGKKCSQGFYFDQLLVCTYYKKDNPLKNIISNFKYKSSKDLGKFLSNILKNKLEEFKSLIPENPIIIPVPIHRKKLRKRGFNQARILAEDCTQTHVSECLSQKEYRGTQTRLGRSDRMTNLLNSIKINKKTQPKIKGRNVLLIDDVATTCSTLNECSRALKEAGAATICAIVIARAEKFF